MYSWSQSCLHIWRLLCLWHIQAFNNLDAHHSLTHCLMPQRLCSYWLSFRSVLRILVVEYYESTIGNWARAFRPSHKSRRSHARSHHTSRVFWPDVLKYWSLTLSFAFAFLKIDSFNFSRQLDPDDFLVMFFQFVQIHTHTDSCHFKDGLYPKLGSTLTSTAVNLSARAKYFKVVLMFGFLCLLGLPFEHPHIGYLW